MSFQHKILLGILLCSLSSLGITQSRSLKEKLIVSNCLLNKIKDKSVVLAQTNQFSLIEAELNNTFLRTMHENHLACGKFLNVEPYIQNKAYKQFNAQQLILKLTQKKLLSTSDTYPIKHDAEVQQLYTEIDPNTIWQTNQHLTSYINRSAKSDSGVAAAYWFKQQFDTLAKDNKRNDVNSFFIKTGKNYKQPSVVTIIGKGKPGDAIVIGAHIDTLSGNMPGADDDSSGISVALEIAKVLLTSSIKLDRPVYIIAYAAEERGLVGSGYVVQYFLNKKIPVKAVMQLDQSGYRANPKDNTIWLLTDYVAPDLTQFMADILTHYVKIPVAYTQCDYACSDHVNWSNEGFKASYPSATTLENDNPYIHTSEDKLEILNLEHMVNFTKLGLAFVAELGLK